MTFRRVAPLDLRGVEPTAPADFGEPPDFVWVSPTDIFVDDRYQRELSERSRRLIRRIVEGWSWRKFKPPILSRTEEGLEAVDGQHTAIAAATLLIPLIPALVTKGDSLKDRASAFLSHNRDRVGVTATQAFHAAVAGGEPSAVAAARVCESAGVVIIRTLPGRPFRPRETMAVGAIQGLVKRRGEEEARRVLAILVEADEAPVSATGIRAIEHLLYAPEFEGEVDSVRLVRRIAGLKGTNVLHRVAAFAVTHKVPMWRALAAVWFQETAKKREPPIRKAQNVRLV